MGRQKMNSSRFQFISPELYRQVEAIPPTGGPHAEYRPALVKLADGSMLDYVYLIEAGKYIRSWAIWPEDDGAKQQVSIGDIVSIEESPSRLPVAIAEKLYEAGESGMGYCIFTLVFDDGTKESHLRGGAIDFVDYPDGKSAVNIVDVLPHEGRKAEHLQKGPDYYWAIYALPGTDPYEDMPDYLLEMSGPKGD